MGNRLPARPRPLQFLRLGRGGYAKVMRNCSATATHLAKLIDGLEHFKIVRCGGIAGGGDHTHASSRLGFGSAHAASRSGCCDMRRSADQPHALPLVAFSLVREKSEAHGYDEVGSRLRVVRGESMHLVP